MTNYAETKGLYSLYAKSRIPFVSVRTTERGRALGFIREVSQELQLSTFSFSPAKGLRDLQTDRPIHEDRSLYAALDYAGQAFQSRQNLNFVFNDPSGLEDDNELSRQFHDLVSIAVDRGGTIVIISSDPVWAKLQRLGMSLTLDPPDEGEMKEILKSSLAEYDNRIANDWDDEDFHRAASILTGVSQLEAENIVATLVARGRVDGSAFGELSRAKDRIFSDLSGIERVDVRHTDAIIGGLEGLTSWLERERPFLTADLSERGLRPPRGVLLVGVPGCGKSLSAKAVAQSWDLPLYRLDMASILGQFVGQSESRLREAFATADHVAPCVLWIDEIEKALAGSGTDSTGITTRLVSQFLYWLQESRGRVFVVATANEVRALPGELLRQGRFNQIFFVDLPDPEERRDILNIYFKRYIRSPMSADLFERLVQMTDGYSGADLEAACAEIGKAEIRADSAAVSEEVIVRCFENIVPMIATNPERIEEIRRFGRDRAFPASGSKSAPPVGGVRGRSVIMD